LTQLPQQRLLITFYMMTMSLGWWWWWWWWRDTDFTSINSFKRKLTRVNL